MKRIKVEISKSIFIAILATLFTLNKTAAQLTVAKYFEY